MPYPTSGISWPAGKLSQPSPSFNRGKIRQIQAKASQLLQTAICIACKLCSTIHMQVECYSTSSVSCPTFSSPLTQGPSIVNRPFSQDNTYQLEIISALSESVWSTSFTQFFIQIYRFCRFLIGVE